MCPGAILIVPHVQSCTWNFVASHQAISILHCRSHFVTVINLWYLIDIQLYWSIIFSNNDQPALGTYITYILKNAHMCIHGNAYTCSYITRNDSIQISHGISARVDSTSWKTIDHPPDSPHTVEPLYCTIGGVHESIVLLENRGKITWCCYDSDLM